MAALIGFEPMIRRYTRALQFDDRFGALRKAGAKAYI